MIIVITCYEEDPITKKKVLVASHGIEHKTDKVVILPCEKPEDLGATWDSKLREWVIRNLPQENIQHKQEKKTPVATLIKSMY